MGRDNDAKASSHVHGLRVLFFLRGIHFGRVFENFLRALLERGHELHIVLSLEKRGLGDDKTRLFDALRARYPSFSYEQLEPRREPWLRPAVALRHGLDYLRYLEPEFARADPVRERARQRAPILVRAFATFPFRGKVGRMLLRGMLRRVEAAVPVSKRLTELVRARNPNVVLVSPLVGLGSIESDYVRAAEAAGVPTVLPVASWDNLTNKGVLRDVPTLTIVWNEAQVEEAVNLHGVPRDQVVAVGAHSFDHWFEWHPGTTREEFAKRMNLDPERPLLLYLGSSYFIAGDETRFIREWLVRIREHPRLREAAVILRPHPQNVIGWDTLDVDEPGKTIVWPRIGTAPTDDEKKTEFFDTLYHASAVVGINTSALIEASIVGRPVLTLVSDHFTTQEGTLHFSYIAHDNNGQGVVTVARDWDKHLEQLAAALDAPSTYQERIKSFLTKFVRPNGLDAPAAPAAVDAVERAAASPAPRRRFSLLRPLLVLLTPVLPLILPLFQPKRTWRHLLKLARRLVKRIRQLRKGIAKARKRRRAATAPARPAARQAKVKLEQQAPGRPARVEPEQAKTARPATVDNPDTVPVAKAAAAEEVAMRQDAKAQAAKEKERARAEKEKARAEKEKARAEKERKAREASAPVVAVPTKKKPARSRPLVRRMRRAPARARKLTHRGLKQARRRWKLTKRGARAVYNRRYRYTYGSTIMKVPSRDEIPTLLNTRGLVGRGAEIGVKTGRFSDHILRNWRGEQLISIDPWREVDWDEYVDRSNVSQDEQERCYQETVARLEPYAARSQIWRMTSVEAAAHVPDGSLDFAYIDARHDYASVLEDLEAWFPKVKPGGILAGHDYVDGMLVQGDFGVKSAVDEFFGARGIPVRGTDGPTAVELFPSWIVEVPGKEAAVEPAADATAAAPAPKPQSARDPAPLASAADRKFAR